MHTDGGSLLELTVTQLLDRLGSDSPTPGGGAAAALAGALAAGLGRMVCALTVGRSKFAAVAPEVRAIDARLANLDAALRRLVDEDAAAYGRLSEAFKLPKTDPQRSAQIQAAARIAAAVPLEVCGLAKAVQRQIERLAQIGNPNLAADVQSGLALATASAQSAAANVRANLPLLPEGERSHIEREL